MPSIFASAGRAGVVVDASVGEGIIVGADVGIAVGIVVDRGVLVGSGVSVGTLRGSSTDEVCGTAANTGLGSCCWLRIR